MPRTSSIAKNTRQYLYGFLWLAIAVAVAGIVNVISSVIPNQAIIIGGYTVSTVPTTVTTTVVTTPPPPTGICSGWWFMNHPTIVLTSTSATVTTNSSTQGINFLFFVDGDVRITLQPDPNVDHELRVYSASAQCNLIGSDSRGAGVAETVEIRNYRGWILISVTTYYYSYGRSTLTITYLSERTTVVNTYTTTYVTTVNTLIPAGNAVTISNRTFLEIVGFGACIAIMLNAITKVMRMRI